MDVEKEMAKVRAEMKDKIVKACKEEQLVGRLVRNFGLDEGVWQRWGIVQSLTIEDGMLVLRAGERESFGHEPFESSMALDSVSFDEDEGAAFIRDSFPVGWTMEWKFYSIQSNEGE